MKLININIDQAKINTDLVNALSGHGTFQAAFPGETGTILVQIATSLATLLLYRIDAATKNNFLSTSFATTSAYANATSMGVIPKGRTPASLPLKMSLPTNNITNMSIPPGTIFQGRGVDWYTAQPYGIVSGQETLEFTVFQGTPTSSIAIGNGLNYQRIIVSDSFKINEGSISVSVDNVIWTQEPTSSLIQAGATNSFIIKVTPTGQYMILFGNGVSGNVPSAGSTIKVSWTESVGSKANSSLVGDSFSSRENLSIVYTDLKSTSAASGGADEENLEYLKITAPRLFAAQQQAARRQDHTGWLLRYPGVISSCVWGEYEEALDKGFADNSMMNRAYFTVLLNNIEVKSGLIGTAFSGLNIYTLQIPEGISVIPGSVRLSIQNDVFYDNDDYGYLYSDLTTPNIASGGTASASSVAANSNVYFCWNNTNTLTYYSSGIKASAHDPVILYYTLPTAKIFAAIRVQAVSSDSQETRSFPKKIQLYGTNDNLPYSNTTNWTKLGWNTNLPDPGRELFTPWITIQNLAAYKGIRIDILESYGESSTVNISNIQIAQRSEVSRINYSTNVINLSVPFAYDGPINAQYATPNLSPNDIRSITDYIASKTMFTTQITFRNPIMNSINVDLDVHLSASANPSNTKNLIIKALNTLYTLNPYSLGAQHFISDIYRVVLPIPGIDHIYVKSPAYDIIPQKNQFQYLENIKVSFFLSSRAIAS